MLTLGHNGQLAAQALRLQVMLELMLQFLVVHARLDGRQSRRQLQVLFVYAVQGVAAYYLVRSHPGSLLDEQLLRVRNYALSARIDQFTQ